MSGIPQQAIFLDIFSLNGKKIKLGERDNCFIGLGYLLGIGIHPDGLGEKI